MGPWAWVGCDYEGSLTADIVINGKIARIRLRKLIDDGRLEMSYYFSKTLSVPFDDGVSRVTDALKE